MTTPPRDRKPVLSAAQLRVIAFAEIYCRGGIGAREAAIEVGVHPDAAKVTSDKWLTQADFKVIKREVERKRTEEARSTGKRVRSELEHVGFSNIRNMQREDGSWVTNLHELPEHVSRAIESIKVRPTKCECGLPAHTLEIKQYKKTEALIPIAKHEGELKDVQKHEHEWVTPSDDLLTQKLGAYLAESGLAICTTEERRMLDARQIEAGE